MENSTKSTRIINETFPNAMVLVFIFRMEWIKNLLSQDWNATI